MKSITGMAEPSQPCAGCSAQIVCEFRRGRARKFCLKCRKRKPAPSNDRLARKNRRLRRMTPRAYSIPLICGYCAYCGKDFCGTRSQCAFHKKAQGHRRYCSKPCMIAMHKKELTRPRTALRMRRMRAVAKRKRSLSASNGGVAIDAQQIYVRDGWRCQYCGCDTPERLKGTFQPNAPEIDHRMPLSKGGKHIHSNVCCSCRACNLKKGSMQDIEFMNLIANAGGVGEFKIMKSPRTDRKSVV